MAREKKERRERRCQCSDMAHDGPPPHASTHPPADALVSVRLVVGGEGEEGEEREREREKVPVQ